MPPLVVAFRPSADAAQRITGNDGERRSYFALKSAESCVSPQWIVKVPASSRLSRLSVSSSAFSEALLSASGTEAKSADGSWSVPNTPAFLLKTSVHLLPASFRAQMLYLPLGTVTSPKARSASVENVVESSAPRRQKPPTFKRPSNCCIVRPLSDGRPYSTETVLPPKSSLAVPRGLPCARQAVPPKAAITITLHAALLDRFMSLSLFLRCVLNE